VKNYRFIRQNTAILTAIVDFE